MSSINFICMIIMIFVCPIILYAKSHEFQNIVVFGDSLIDAGVNGRFLSNGNASDNYVDVISQNLTGKQKVLPLTEGGTSYAMSGSMIYLKSIFLNYHDLYSNNKQTFYYLTKNTPSKDNMYIYWIGGIDIQFHMMYDNFIKLATEFKVNSYPNYNNPLMKISKKLFVDKNINSLTSQITSQFDAGAKYVTI